MVARRRLARRKFEDWTPLTEEESAKRREVVHREAELLHKLKPKPAEEQAELARLEQRALLISLKYAKKAARKEKQRARDERLREERKESKESRRKGFLYPSPREANMEDAARDLAAFNAERED